MGWRDRLAGQAKRAALAIDLGVALGIDDFVRKSRLPVDITGCWWCLSGKAETSEHRYPRAVFGLVHGRGGYPDEQRPWVAIEADRAYEIKSDNAYAIKYPKSLCAKCNNQRSQPMDTAFRLFASYVYGRGRLILEDGRIDFADVYGPNAAFSVDQLLRAFAKDLGCRIRHSGRYVPQVIRRMLTRGVDSRVLQVAFFASEAPYDAWMGKTALYGGFGPTVFEFRFFYEMGHLRALVGLNQREGLSGLKLVEQSARYARIHEGGLVPYTDSLAARRGARPDRRPTSTSSEE